MAAAHPEITRVVHLAAQAGVRYSLENPYAYVQANLVGQIVMLELCRRLPRLEHFVYASSSSVYGGNTKVPFSIEDRTDTPISLYAATKKADEHMSHCYSHLYRIPATGLPIDAKAVGTAIGETFLHFVTARARLCISA